MSTENMKNMVVLKNLPSNIVDEAIIILKPNVKVKSLDLAENKKESKNVKNADMNQVCKIFHCFMPNTILSTNLIYSYNFI